jgi:uncharacterized surface protein with fasciclin (FAS1) repeats
MKKIFLGLFLSLSAMLAFTACDDDDDDNPQPQAKNIVQLAQETPQLSILAAAVVHADLVSTLSGTTELTVFAPTNDAFNALLMQLGLTNVTQVDKTVLKNILLYHVIAGEVKAANVTTGYVATQFSPAVGGSSSPLSLYLSTVSGVGLNGVAKVTTADVDASNGVVHIIDKVLTLPTIVTHALGNPNFSTLVAALTRTDLNTNYVNILSGAGPFTVFAPTNAAFTAALTELNFANLNAIPANLLNEVLKYHVVSGAKVRAADITNNQEVTTFQGGKFKLEKSATAVTILDARNRRANVIATDVFATNGVIHAIDKVILP